MAYGEGGVLDSLASFGGDPASQAGPRRVIEKLNLGTVLGIGETCGGEGSLCPGALRRYLEGCPVLPVPDKDVIDVLPWLQGKGNSLTILKSGMMDVLFARQCLARAYP